MKNGELITLSSGLRVICLQKSNFRTTSVRINVKAGSLHQTVPATAHFFEHICFQGTTEFPSQKELNDFADSNAIYKNAYTSQSETVFYIDGPELETVIKLATQIAFHPLLTEESLKRERAAVVDEARAIQFSPGMKAKQRQWKTLAGKKFAELVTGTIEEISKVTHEDLLAFHKKHYRPGNTIISICSSEPVDSQIEIIRNMTANVIKKVDQKPTLLNLPWLSTTKKIALEKNELDEQSQTHITLNYSIKAPIDYRQYLLEVTATNVINSKAHEHLRENLVLAYSAGCSVSFIQNRNFNAREDYQSLALYSSVAGEIAEICLEELKRVPNLAYNDTKLIQNKINSIRYSGAVDEEANASQSADNMSRSVQIEYDGVYVPSKFVEIVQSFSVAEVQKEILKITEELKLIQITSPSQKVLNNFKNKI